MVSVDVLMATYNGDRYIKNQILSLQQQTFSDWKLLIRDDGSTDNTLEIINELRESDERINIVNEGECGNKGPGKSFLSLTKYSNSDYVLFCDQDDIWFEKKIEILLRFAEDNFNNNIPCLVYCDAYGYADKDGIITINGIARNNAHNASALKNFLYFNGGYQGCSILFNRSLCTMLKNYNAEYFYMHDDVASLLCHVFGKVYFIDKLLMLYRQHDSNVTGNINSSFLTKIKRITSINSFVLSSNHYLEKKSFYYYYKDQLTEEQLKLFEAYLVYPDSSLVKRLWIVLWHGFSLGESKLALIVKTLLRRPIEREI